MGKLTISMAIFESYVSHHQSVYQVSKESFASPWGLRVLHQLIFQLRDPPLGVQQPLAGVREDLVLLRQLTLGLVCG